MKIERILVGTDRSETATRAVTWALDMARRYDAELIVLQAGGRRTGQSSSATSRTTRRGRAGGSTPRKIQPRRSSPPRRPRTWT